MTGQKRVEINTELVIRYEFKIDDKTFLREAEQLIEDGDEVIIYDKKGDDGYFNTELMINITKDWTDKGYIDFSLIWIVVGISIIDIIAILNTSFGNVLVILPILMSILSYFMYKNDKKFQTKLYEMQKMK